MMRHWRELHRAFSKRTGDAFAIHCPLGAPPAETPPAGRLLRIFENYLAYPLRTRWSGHADVVHLLDHSYAHLMRWTTPGACRIVTVHDLAPLEDPGSLAPGQLRRFRRTVEWLNQTDILLADSEYTRNALRSFLTAAPRTEVLPMGVDVASFSRPGLASATAMLPRCPKILSVGSCLSRKNLALLPETLRRVGAAIGPVALIRAGEVLPRELRQRLEAVLAPGHLVELGKVSDDTLVALYHACDALLFPSHLEGFGLPVAEAMAAGCPAVCSRASSIPEVGRDAVLYFDPSSPAEAAEALLGVLQNRALRDTLVERGHRRARELSWENHAARLAEIYTGALARRVRE